MNLIPLRFFSKETFIIWYFPMILIVALPVFNNANADSSPKLPTAAEVFSKAMEAKSTVDYVGKRIVIRWHSLAPSFRAVVAFEERVIHKTPSTHIVELLTPVDRIAPDKNDRSESRKMSGQKERERMRRMLPPPREMRELQDIWETDTQLLLRNYTVDVAEGEPIAGQKTYLLLINPKVVSRPKKKVWLDAQHYIILRMEDYDIAGKLNSLSVYTTIDYDSASVAQQLKRYQEEQSQKEQGRDPNRPRPYQSEETSFAEAEKQFGAKLPQPSHLPTGFQLQSISVMTFRGKRIHFRYTDGLTVLSLFVSKVGDEREERQPRRARGDRFRGGKPTTVTVKNTPISVIDQGHIRILQWKVGKQGEKGNLRFVLMGELSQEELVKVAESLVSQGYKRK